MSLSFAHAWQQQELSDVDVILLVPEPSAESGQQDGQPAKVELARFPAHSILLSNSAMLRCRVLRWQDTKPCTRAAKRARRNSSSNNGSSAEQAKRDTLELELQDASEQHAALAVLQSLYAVKPLPELLSELSQEQQLQAAVLADKWQVPLVSSAAADILAEAASTGVLEQAVQQHMLSAQALPDCLQPLLKRVLLSLLGDLEAVWTDAGLQEQLLQLPVHSMELLLSCDELKVASEDTVLYTARRYCSGLEDQEQKQFAKEQLARVIRCQHLSHYWLSGLVNSAKLNAVLLAELRPQMRLLLLLRDSQNDYTVNEADLQEDGRLAGAPPSWLLGRRVFKAVASVQLVWQLEISKLRDAARSCAADQEVIEVRSPPSPPLGGVDFGLKVMCDVAEGGSQLGLYFGPDNLPDDMFCQCTFLFGVDGADPTHRIAVLDEPHGGDEWSGWGWFGLGPMAGGWDEVAWARMGLPTSGHLPIKLKVCELSHVGVPHMPVGRRRR